jgi:inward rectifier potassium channel
MAKEKYISPTRQVEQLAIRDGLKNSLRKDIYFFLIQTSWVKLIGIFLLIYLFSNLIFAFIYYKIPNSISQLPNLEFLDAFFFSIQTMATIGFGVLHPTGILSNIVVTIEAAFGLIGVALITGLFFAKLSKPSAKIIFSDKMVIAKFDGAYCLSFRMGNARSNEIIEASVSVTALISEITSEGEKINRIKDLNLLRGKSPFFKYSWTVFHPMNELSPLYNFDQIKDSIRAITVILIGHDGTLSNTVFSRHNYNVQDIVKDRYFEDIIENKDDGIHINYRKFHQLKD